MNAMTFSVPTEQLPKCKVGERLSVEIVGEEDGMFQMTYSKEGEPKEKPMKKKGKMGGRPAPAVRKAMMDDEDDGY